MGFGLFGNKKRKQIEEDKEEQDDCNMSDETSKNIQSNVILAANSQTIGRHANAASEYIKAYTGKNYQAQGALKQDMHQSLKDIENWKINPNDADRNMKQHAGYAAEVMEVADRNAEEILKGSDTRYARADDVKGHKINETKHDIVKMDSKGNESLGPKGQSQGEQMKFVKIGKTPEETAKRLWQKDYRNAYPEGEYCVAKDKYDGVKAALSDRETELQRQIDKAKQKGNTELAQKRQEELDYVKKVNKNLKKAKTTEKEALATTQKASEWTTKKVVEMGGRAGLECAKSAAAITFVSSFSQNLVGYLKGDVDEETALKNIAKDTAKGATGAFVIGSSTAVISSAMLNSSNEVMRKFIESYPDAPGYVVSFTMQTFAVVGKCLKGEITEKECFAQVGKNAMVMGGSIAGKTIGTKVGTAIGAKVGTAIGGKVGTAIGAALGPVGAMVGSFVGSIVVSTAIDVVGKEIANIERANVMIKEQKQRLEDVKAKYAQLCKELDEYDRIFRETYIAHTEELRAIFGNSIYGMAQALNMNDADAFIVQTNNITHALGQNTQFNSVSEFKAMVKNKVPLEL